MRALLGVAVALVAAAPAVAAPTGSTTLIDRPSGLGGLPSDQVNGAFMNTSHAISFNGDRYVFQSDSDGLLPAGANPAVRHIFVRDRSDGTTTLVDDTAGGAASDSGAYSPVISRDGSHVAFVSSATNLGAAGGAAQIYVKDVDTGALTVASRDTSDAVGTSSSDDPVLDETGAHVAFQSNSGLDIAHDSNSSADVYVRDLGAAKTTLISRVTNGTTAVGNARWPDISAGGGVVVFTTDAAIDAGKDANGKDDIYLRSGTTTTLVSVNPAGTAAGTGGGAGTATVSGDGTKVAFSSQQTDLVANDDNDVGDIFVRDMSASTTLLVSRGPASVLADESSYAPAISGDGNRVAFTSDANNLLKNLAVDHRRVYERILGMNATTLLVSRADGASGAAADGSSPSVTDSGRLVLFEANDDGLPRPGVDVLAGYLRDTLTGSTVLATGGPGAPDTYGSVSSRQSVSADGRWVAFESRSDGLSDADQNQFTNVFVRDVATNELHAIAPGGDGSSFQPGISADGSTVVFNSYAHNLVPNAPSSGVYRETLATGAIELVSRFDGADGMAVDAQEFFDFAVSADGNRIAFITPDPVDAAHDTNTANDIYLRDMAAGTTTLVSRADGADGAAGNSAAYDLAIDAAGDRVAWTTDADNLGDGDTNATGDVHLRDLTAGSTTLVSRANGADGALGDSGSDAPALSADGHLVAFESHAKNLGDGDDVGTNDIHVRDVTAGTTSLVSLASFGPSISADGRSVAFIGVADHQVSVRDRVAQTTVVASRADGAAGAAVSASRAWLSAGGGCLVFTTGATGVVAGGYPSPDFEHVYERAVSGECPVAPVVTPTVTPTVSPTATPTPRDRTKPRITRVHVKRKKLSFRLSEKARVKVTVKRGKKTVKTVRRTLTPGKLTLKLRLKRPGRYRITIVATDAAGNRSKTVHAKLRLKRKKAAHRRPS